MIYFRTKSIIYDIDNKFMQRRKIPYAVKVGRRWQISDNTQKPKDKEIRIEATCVEVKNMLPYYGATNKEAKIALD